MAYVTDSPNITVLARVVNLKYLFEMNRALMQALSLCLTPCPLVCRVYTSL